MLIFKIFRVFHQICMYMPRLKDKNCMKLFMFVCYRLLWTEYFSINTIEEIVTKTWIVRLLCANLNWI